ncbi:MAG: translation initiation factor IF-2 N-terminal domain-containing protein, partial [Blastocatellia bacterium]|nr:translation initiation factor IF-2 N-terminal domain-containing protein [Blastocatellia bacterium]
MSKVRIYDLAKELKLESKKVLEDARRMGVDVSVPSNTLDDNIAAKIREMYYPKKEQTAIPQKARLIKHPPVPSTITTITTSGSSAPQKIEQKAEQKDQRDQRDQRDQKDQKASANAAGQARVEQPAAPAPSSMQAKTQQPAVKTAPAETKPQPAVNPVINNEAPKARVVKLVTPQPATQKAEPAAPEPEPEPEVAPVAAPAPVPQVPEASEPAAVRAEPVKPVKEETPVAEPVRPAPPVVQKPHAKVVSPSAPPSGTGSGETKSSGTKVIKLAPPTRPLPKPKPPQPKPQPQHQHQQRPQQKPSQAPREGAQREKTITKSGGGQAAALKPQLREGQRDVREKQVHILPSGAQQRTVYIPPQNQRPKGRHQVRKDKEAKDKEGQQKVMPRRQVVANPTARPV